MRDFLEDLGKKIGETAETFTNKAGEVVEVQRIRNQIRTMERSNERDFRDIGRMIYDKYKEGEVIDTEMVCICEEIEKREEAAEEMEKMIADVKGAVICQNCQKPLGKGMSFCPYCGEKVEAAEEECEECESTEEAEVVEEAAEAAEEAAEEIQETAEAVKETAEAVKETAEADEKAEE